MSIHLENLIKIGIILTYFQMDVGVQLLQFVRHAVRLDAGQLGQKKHSERLFYMAIHPQSQRVMSEHAADWHLDKKESSRKKGAIVRLQPLSLWQGARGVLLFKHTEAHIGTRHAVKVAHPDTAVLYLTLAGPNPDDPADLAVPILPRHKKRQRGLKLLLACKIFLPPHAHTLL